jgi:hypothetical protein
MDLKRAATVLGLATASEGEVFTELVPIRQLLSAPNPPIDACIKAGLIPHILRHMQAGSTGIQEEAAWIITNIASGTTMHVQALLQHNAAAILVQACSSPHVGVVKQCVWALGNIAGDGALSRDLVLSLGFVPIVCGLFSSPMFNEIGNNLLWSASNLCRGKPTPSWNLVSALVPQFAKCVLLSPTGNPDAWWGLSYLSDGANIQLTVASVSVV